MEIMQELEKVVLTVGECANYLRISRSQAYLGIHRGEIPHITIGKKILIPKVALDKMLENA